MPSTAAQADAIYRALQDMPTVAGVSLKSDARNAFKVLMDTGAGAIRYVMGAVAFVITFGIVYNSARIAHAERARDLASLRVIGFTKGETAFVLLGRTGRRHPDCAAGGGGAGVLSVLRHRRRIFHRPLPDPRDL